MQSAAGERVRWTTADGEQNARRDRELKLKLYSVRGVLEYWIVDWQLKHIEIYRREQQALRLTATLLETDTISSPLLPGFACALGPLFA
ncbi:Uma2 family endonuclease [Gloeobacter violaceus]|uniref:Gsl0355 protein n=1 Tax=Gloeobacter violaceus (strain ATCC 29082 / PCC 7421) TaxID=251221 RepID=Q7NNQ5_GLOVI|nr:Uma2 family endonuclease [Gloeobacter violaceus]BAC88296.1 gsl0355 [Gloeobacter violaceus PCC 7421]